jgi:hypothetical protein
MTAPALTSDQNLLPVQAYFDVYGNFQTFIGQGQPFYATVNPSQSGLNITNSTINSTTIGLVTPSSGAFTNISTVTGTISTTAVNPTDLVNKSYVDAVAQGLAFKQPAQVATTTNITLSGLQTIDGYTTLSGDRVLVKNQGTQANNGIYIASASGWTRSTDADTYAELVSAFLFVENGGQSGSAWVSTIPQNGTLGTTAITFSQFSNSSVYTAGTGLTLSGYQFSITPVGTAGTYGSASSVPVFVTNASGQVSSVTNTSISIAPSQINATIPNSGLTNSSITINGSSISLGGSATITAVNPNALTIGTGLSGTSYNGSTAVTIANTGVLSFSGGTTGFTPNTTSTGAITLGGTLNASNGGTGATTLTGYVYGNGTGAMTASTTIPTSALSGNFVSTFQTSLSGLTPSTSTTGAVTLAGTLGVSSGGTGVTSSSGANSVVLRDSNANITWNNEAPNLTNIASSGGTTTLTIASSYYQHVTGSSNQTIKLPDLTTIPLGMAYIIDNDSTGTVTVTDSAGSTVYSGPSGSAGYIYSYGNGSATGNWGGYLLPPANSSTGFVSWGTNTLSMAGQNITNSVWNGSLIGLAYGGTNANLTASAGAIAYSTASALALSAVGTTGQFLQSNGTSAPTWATPVSYASVTDDTTTNGTRYPLFANQTSGSISTEYTSSTKYQYNPSTGTLTATVFSGAGTGLTGTASSLSIGGNSATSTLATSATNLAGGANGSLPYQTGSGATTFLAASTNGYILTLAGGVPTWATAPVSGITITDNTSSSSTYYPTLTTATTGTITGETTSSTKLSFVPNTGILTATGFAGTFNGSIGATTRSSGDFTTLSANTVTSTTPVLSFNASNTIASFGSTTASSYNQLVIQNLSNSAGASTNYVISNNLGTDSTYYGEFGMNSSTYTASGTFADFFSINNGIYFSGHDGDITVGSGNGFKYYFAWGTTGQSAHVINASGAIGLSTNLGTTPATTGTTGYGTTGQVLTSQGSSAAPIWANASGGSSPPALNITLQQNFGGYI